MGGIVTRATNVGTYLLERLHGAVPEASGDMDGEVVFLLDGVGGFEIAPLLVRRALRQSGDSLGTVVYHWQRGVTGEIFTDLMWLRRNRVMAAQLARKLLAFRRSHPHTTMHVMAFSGGAGVATFAMEHLRGRARIDTLVLACPAMSPTYNLAGALRSVTRAYALVSARDKFLLGLGTTLFGTTDRVHTRAAGLTGFKIPRDASADQRRAYARLREVHWIPELRQLRHYGGHTDWANVAFLRCHLVPMLHGQPRLETNSVQEEA